MTPHPRAFCPLCGCPKPNVAWSACSQHCADLMRATDPALWKLPDAPRDGEEPLT